MGETKSGGKTGKGSEKFRCHSENFVAIAKFRYGSEIFAMSIANFFFFEK